MPVSLTLGSPVFLEIPENTPGIKQWHSAVLVVWGSVSVLSLFARGLFPAALRAGVPSSCSGALTAVLLGVSLQQESLPTGVFAQCP